MSESPEHVALRPGLQYSVAERQSINGLSHFTGDSIRHALRELLVRVEDTTLPARKKKPKSKPEDPLRKAIAAAVPEFSPVLIDHALKETEINSNTPLERVLEDELVFQDVMLAVNKARSMFESLGVSDSDKGYIVATTFKKPQALSDEIDVADNHLKHRMKYIEFHPFKPRTFLENDEVSILEFGRFNTAVDEFFSSVESQKLESRLNEREEVAKRKLEHARLDHERRLGGLQQVQELNVRKAQVIEANLQIVQEAISAVNSLLAQGMDWQNVARLIEVEKRRQNPVAEIIRLPLKLYENAITLALSEGDEDEPDFEGDETDSDVSEEGKSSESTAAKADSSADKRLQIDVDLALSPWSNARQYYDQKKNAAVKEQKTLQASGKALKSAEKKIEADLKKGLQQEKDLMRPQRNTYWFEKFIYFISSDGYLVIGGKDAQQSDIIYQRHFKKGDVFVHADLQGATPLIIKNRSRTYTDPIPPSTLSQAGTLTVSTSVAWDSKAVMAAWSVHSNQVSKLSAHGDLLPAGIFATTGEKNFMPPAQLLLGFGVFFKISEESKTRHQRFRVRDPSPDHSLREGPSDAIETESTSPVGESESKAPLDTNGAKIPTTDDDADAGAADPERSISDIEDEADADSTTAFNPLQPNGPDDDQDHVPQTEINEEHGSDVGFNEGLENKTRPAKSAMDSNTDNDKYHTNTESQEASFSGIDNERATLEEDDHTLSSQLSSPAKETPAPSEHPNETQSTLGSSKSQQGQQQQQQQQQPIRGKRGKRQKQKTKYAHQDEEDRALAMRLLGSAAVHERAQEAAAEKEAKQKELADQKERRRKQHAQVAERSRAAEEARKRDFERGVDDDEDQEAEQSLVDLEAFVGAPLPGDEIVDALVVCGPWEAIGPRCRWKAKLQPGAVKKGKAVKDILSTWNAVAAAPEAKKRGGSGAGNEVMIEEEKIRRREAELIKAIRDVEVIGLVPVGKVRVLMGGGDKNAAGGKGGGGRGGKGNRGKGSGKKK